MDEVVVGEVGKPLGVDGEVYVRPDTDVPHDFAPGITFSRPDGTALRVVSSRAHGNRTVVRFAGIAGRAAAESLRGVVLRVPRGEVQLPDDRLWSDALIGREVTDYLGHLVGVVEAVADGPAHDYLVIARPDGGEVMVPVVADLLDVGDDAIVVQAIPGLLDPDAPV